MSGRVQPGAGRGVPPVTHPAPADARPPTRHAATRSWWPWPMPPGDTHLLAENISKRFGAITALSRASLALRRGEVTGLVGDNGAGKSTLMKIVAGVFAPDQGRMSLDGAPLHIHNPADAVNAGIQTVFQDLALCENLDVSANLFLGYEQTVGGAMRLLPRVLRPLAALDMEAKARDALDKLDVRTLKAVRAKVGALSGGQRQAVAIARAVRADSSVVLLDEPTAALGVAQTAQVLDVVRQLRANGHAVLYISHNLQDVFAVCDNIAVLRHGAIVGVWPAASASADEIVAAITHGRGPQRDAA